MMWSLINSSTKACVTLTTMAKKTVHKHREHKNYPTFAQLIQKKLKDIITD